MGWTFTNKGSRTTKEFFEKEFNYVRDNGMSGTIIRFSATWTTAYMAYEVKTPATAVDPAKREVIAIVCLIRHVPNAADGFTFGYKDMTESMGPCERKCPGTILALLTPTTSEYAIEWRKDCQARIDKRKAAPKVKAGDWVTFAKAITFRSGAELDTMQWVKGSTFKVGYNLYRLPNWKEREYKVAGQQYFFKGKGTTKGIAGQSVTIDLSGRFIASNPTAKDAFAAALSAYPAVEFESVTFAPVIP